jgi:hypothetical protein
LFRLTLHQLGALKVEKDRWTDKRTDEEEQTVVRWSWMDFCFVLFRPSGAG